MALANPVLRTRLNPFAAIGVLVAVVLVIQALFLLVPEEKEAQSSAAALDSNTTRPRLLNALEGQVTVPVTTFAGGEPGFRDGPLWQAQFCGPNALRVVPGTEGAETPDLLVCDSRNHRIRRISKGRVETVAGGGDPGGPGGQADGPAAQARFRYPSGLAVTEDGTIYVSDSGNHRICVIRNGQVTPLAGGTEGQGDGTGAAARFRHPGPLALDTEGMLWVGDDDCRVFRKINVTTGQVTTAVTAPTHVAAILGQVGRPKTSFVLRKDSNPYYSSNPQFRNDPVNYQVGRRSPGAVTRVSDEYGKTNLVLVYADVDYHVLMYQLPQEKPRVLAGRREPGVTVMGSVDGAGNDATFAGPCAVVFAPGNRIFVAEYEGNRIRELQLSRDAVRAANADN